MIDVNREYSRFLQIASRAYQVIEQGDHHIVIGEVVDAHLNKPPAGRPDAADGRTGRAAGRSRLERCRLGPCPGRLAV